MGSKTSAANSLAQQIRQEQINILFQHAPLAQATNLIVATVLVWFLWGFVSPVLLLVWWLLIIVVVLFRLGLVFGFRRRSADSPVAWHTLMTGATAVSGILWGAAGVLFFMPDSAPVLVFVTIILAGMAAGSISSHSSWLPAQFSYAILTMVPISVRFLFEGTDLSVMGLMCLVYLFNILAFARQLSRTLIDSIRLRLERQELVLQLREEMVAADQARAMAEEANRAKSKFLAAASHDLRQPLHAINLFIEALRNENDPARAGTVLAHLGAAAESLEKLFNELLDISKLEAGLFKPQTGVLVLQEIFDMLEQELRPVAEEKGIELCFVGTRIRIESDSSMLERILRNIITNAIHYNTARGTVLVGCRRRGDRVAIAVYDTGPGIAPEHHQAIFREFYQLENPERNRRKGLGLGLAIVDGLCRLLGHRVELKSRLGHGSAFLIHVPVAAGNVHGEPHLAEDAVEIPAGLQGLAVLVIDDDPDICVAMAEVLGGWGCRVRTAESARDALELLSTENFMPDMIIADYRLREGATGSGAIAEIRHALARPVRAAILTGDTDPERLREASASGFLLLHKPIQPARLRAALTHWREESPGGTS